MKRPIPPLVALAAGLIAILPAHAVPLAYEGFNGYVAGQLPGQTISANTVGLNTAAVITNAGTGGPSNVFNATGMTFSDLIVNGGSGLYDNPAGQPSYIGWAYAGPTVAGTLYSSFLVNLLTPQNTAGNVGLRVNTSPSVGVASSYFYSFADTNGSLNPGIQYDNTGGVVNAGPAVAANTTYAVVGRFTRVGEALTAATPGVGTTFILTAEQFDHFKVDGFTDAELDGATVGAASDQVYARVADLPVTSGAFNIFSAGRGIQIGPGNAGVGPQTIAYDEIRFGFSLNDVLPIVDAPPPPLATVTLDVTQASASEPTAANSAIGSVTITRTGDTATQLVLNLAITGTASNGDDFVSIPAVASIPSGAASIVVQVKPYTDAAVEGNETAIVSVVAGNGYVLGPNVTGQITIQDRPPNVPAARSRFVQKLAAGVAQRIVVFGTSLTANGAWTTQVTAALNAAFPGLTTLINSGGSGMASDWGLANVDAMVIASTPDVVFIEFSVNDAVDAFHISVAQARANLEGIIAGIQNALPNCEIIVQITNPVIDHPQGVDGWRPNLPLYQQSHRDSAAQHGFLAIDHTPAWQALLDQGEAAYHTFVPDGLHPNDLGNELYVTPTILWATGAPLPPAPTIFVDNLDPGLELTGSWSTSTATAGYYGPNYFHDGNASKGSLSARFRPDLPFAGNYSVYIRSTAFPNRATNVPVTVNFDGGFQAHTINQQINGGIWFPLGSHNFAAGTAGNVLVENLGTNGFVIADAIAVEPMSVFLRVDNGRPAEPPTQNGAPCTSLITISRKGSTVSELVVSLTIAGSAANNTDYLQLPDSITIPAGASSASITFTPKADSTPEGLESVQLGLIAGSGFVLGSPAQATLLIQDRPFDAWKHANFTAGELNDSNISGDTADPDRDSLNNLLEFYTGRLPKTPDASGATVTGSVHIGNEDYLTLTYSKVLSAEVTGTSQISSNLTQWNSGPAVIVETILTDDGIKQTIQARSIVPISQQPRSYSRLQVTRNL